MCEQQGEVNIMAKLEVALLVGNESKQWLAEATRVVEKMEALLKQANNEGDDEPTPEESFDGTPLPTKKKVKVVPLKAKDVTFDDEWKDDDAPEEVQDPSDEPEEDEDFTTPPPKKAKVKALTSEDVNEACKARAARTGGKSGREEVLTILKKKFKTQSISDLKEDSYAAVIAAMKA